jgi:hypothetical protein
MVACEACLNASCVEGREWGFYVRSVWRIGLAWLERGKAQGLGLLELLGQLGQLLGRLELLEEQLELLVLVGMEEDLRCHPKG